MENTIRLDEDLYTLLLRKAAEQGVEIDVLANAAIRAASKMFTDFGVAYAQMSPQESIENVAPLSL